MAVYPFGWKVPFSFYVVNQIFEYYLTKFNYKIIFKIFYYFCNQEDEEETGAAGEQPVSNKLPVLRCNKFEGTVFVLSLFLFVTDNTLWLRKPNQKFN